MHRILQDFSEDDSRVLDRLVDGELTELERKELLSALDEEPSGWRRCALAFLEAQSWGTDLRAFRDKPEEPPAVTLSSGASAAFARRHWPLALAMAASLLAAFTLGLAIQGRLFDSTGSARAGSDQLAVRGDQPGPIQQNDQHSQALALNSQPVAWKTFKLGLSDGQEFDLKALDGSRTNPAFLLGGSSAIPPELLRRLEMAGHRIETAKELWPVQLDDGSQLIVPVEQVQVQYVSGEAYQ